MERVDKGYPLNSFVWNEERANLGGLFQIDVKLTLPANKVGLKTVDSFIWRNYTIIKDLVDFADSRIGSITQRLHKIK